MVALTAGECSLRRPLPQIVELLGEAIFPPAQM
jgi:hypothetical protein